MNAFSSQEIMDFATLLARSGIVDVPPSYAPDFFVRFTEGMETQAAEALEVLRDRIARIEGAKTKRLFIEMVREELRRIPPVASPADARREWVQ